MIFVGKKMKANIKKIFFSTIVCAEMVKTRFFSKTADECAEYEFLIVVEKKPSKPDSPVGERFVGSR
jgi:hypothetical protein